MTDITFIDKVTPVPTTWLQGVNDLVYGLGAAKGAALLNFTPSAAGAVARSTQAKLQDSVSPLDFGCIGDGVADDTVNFAATVAAVPAYGVLNLLGKTYSITAPPARPAVGVMIRDGRIKLNNSTPQFFYALVANDYCVFDSIYFLGAGVIGGQTAVAFTASVGGATVGTLTAAITDGLYVFTFANGNVRGVTVTGGTACDWSGLGGGALTAGTVTAANYADPSKTKYQGGIIGGNTSYPAPMNVTPANYVSVRNCTFDSLTVGVWSGGAGGDSVPTSWHVTDNNFINIVGQPGISEGYGVLFTPSSDGVIRGNTFKTIRRHSIYLAGEASNNVVEGNTIDGGDNINIQSNTGVTQNYADGNIIANNVIRNITRSIPYGYRSSIGIGLYGKIQHCITNGNKIFGALDTGIDTSGELSGAAYSDRLTIEGNLIVMDPTATDAGIRLDGLQSGKIHGNNIKLQGSVYGIVTTATVGVPSTIIDVTENTIDTTSTLATAFRVVYTSSRNLRVLRNTINGFLPALTSILSDGSSAGIIRTDLNGNIGSYSTDADFSHTSGGTAANKDCPRIVWSGAITAARTLTLQTSNVPQNAQLTLARSATGAFNVNVNDATAGLLKALAVGQWATFGWGGTRWNEIAFGSL